MIIPELFNIICNYLPASDIFSFLLLNKECFCYFNLLSKKNIIKILFTKKNYFNTNYTSFQQNDVLFLNPLYKTHLINTRNIKIISYLISKRLYTHAYIDFLYFAISCGNINMIKCIVESNIVDPSINNNMAIMLASSSYNPEIMEFLLKDSRIDPETNNNYCIKNAIRKGLVDIVKVLMKDKRLNNKTHHEIIFIHACKHGNTEIAELILKNNVISIESYSEHAFMLAIQSGETELVRLLLKDSRINPSAYENAAFRLALCKGYINIAKLLIEDNRVDYRILVSCLQKNKDISK